MLYTSGVRKRKVEIDAREREIKSHRVKRVREKKRDRAKGGGERGGGLTCEEGGGEGGGGGAKIE